MLVEIGRSKISHNICQYNDSTTLVKLWLHHKFILEDVSFWPKFSSFSGIFGFSKHLKAMGMIQKKGNWVPYEFKPRGVDFAACQRSVECCKTGENLLGNAEMGGLTPPAVLSGRCSFRLLFVSMYGTRPGSSAFPLLWRSQKLDWFTSKDASFFPDGIRQLPKRWKKVVPNDGQYF